MHQSSPAPETGIAFREILTELGRLETRITDPDRDLDAQSLLEGYKWIFSILAVGLDAHTWADRECPRFVDIVGRYRKWGGDNADAFYKYAPIDPNRTYRVTVRPGDAAYLSLTIYGGPDDGRYSERIVGSWNDRAQRPGEDGSFEILLSPEPGPTTGAWIRLDPDAVCAITRDYLEDPGGGRPAWWDIEELSGSTAPKRESDHDLARRFRATLTWLRDQAQLVPVAMGEPNTVDEPYPVPTETFGWAAGDAAYAMGRFQLSGDEALVISGRSPECAFWNICLWNQFLHTYDYDHERVTMNGAQIHYEDDGSWQVVIAAVDPHHPNWISTAGHPRGLVWFRWFLPAVTPDRPSARLVEVADLPRVVAR